MAIAKQRLISTELAKAHADGVVPADIAYLMQRDSDYRAIGEWMTSVQITSQEQPPRDPSGADMFSADVALFNTRGVYIVCDAMYYRGEIFHPDDRVKLWRTGTFVPERTGVVEALIGDDPAEGQVAVAHFSVTGDAGVAYRVAITRRQFLSGEARISRLP